MTATTSQYQQKYKIIDKFKVSGQGKNLINVNYLLLNNLKMF